MSLSLIVSDIIAKDGGTLLDAIVSTLNDQLYDISWWAVLETSDVLGERKRITALKDAIRYLQSYIAGNRIDIKTLIKHVEELNRQNSYMRVLVRDEDVSQFLITQDFKRLEEALKNPVLIV